MPCQYLMASSLCTQAGISKKPCPWWLRAIFRVMFGLLCFFLAVAISFYGTIGGLSGGFSLPLTLAIPCFMWVKIKKPEVYSLMRWLNWGLGLLGMALSGILIAAGVVYAVITTGVDRCQIFQAPAN
jgi:hypothetical protein